MNGDGTLRWRALFGWIGAVGGLLGAAPDAVAAASTDAPASSYQSAQSAPAAWQAFAKQLQSRLQEQLAGQDDLAQRFQEALSKRTDAPADAVTVRAWILPDGHVERIELDRPDDAVATQLRALLSRADVGAPPSDMLQPVHVRLSLRPPEEPAKGR